MRYATAKAVGPITVPAPALPYEVSCPDLGYHDWESIEAASGADAALRWARKHTIREEMERYGFCVGYGVPAHVRAPRLNVIYRLIYEDGPVYIAELA